MIPFSPPRIDDKIINEVVDVLKSGWITTGPKTKLFERRITEYIGSKTTICLNSGTAGIELALAWYGVGPGDEVILPAYTYAATANAVIHRGARPVMCDSGSDFNIDVSKIESLITKNTKVILPVDVAGFPCDYTQLNELVNKKEVNKKFNPENETQKKLGRIMILADAAHSIGSEYKGKKAALHADGAVFSFHAVKNLTTAEGGALTFNLPEQFDHEKLYKDLSIKSLHGQTKDAFSKVKKGGWRYDVVEAGYKYNMTDILASIGLVELERYESETLVKRRHIFNLYNELFADCDRALTPTVKTKDKWGNAHLYLLRIKGANEAMRNDIITEITKKDIAVNVHYQPLPMLTFYKKMGYNIDNYPQAYGLYKNEISLPVYYDITDDEIKTVAKAVKSSYNKVIENSSVQEAV